MQLPIDDLLSDKTLNVKNFYQQKLNDLTAGDTVEIDGSKQGLIITDGELTDNDFHVTSADVKGQDLLLTIDDVYHFLVKNYFAKNGKSAFKYIVGSDVNTFNEYGAKRKIINVDEVVNNNLFNSYTLKSDYKKAPKVITGTAFSDTFDFQKAGEGVTINAGAGDDYITGSKNSDTITGGAGKNEISFAVTDDVQSFGDDIVKLTKGEDLEITGTSAITDKTNVVYDAKIDGKDVVVTAYASADTNFDTNDTKIGSFKLEGAAAKDILGNEALGLPHDVSFGTESLKTFKFTHLEAKKGVYTGNYLSEKVANGTDSETYKLGLGNNVVTTDLSDPTKTFGEDKITLTKGEKLTLEFEGDIDGQIYYELSENKKDVVVTAYKTGAVTYTAEGVRNTNTEATADSLTRTTVTVDNETGKTTTQKYKYDATKDAGSKWVADGDAIVVDKKDGDVASDTFVATFGTGETAKTLEFTATGENLETIPTFYKQVALTGTRTAATDATTLTAGTEAVGYSETSTGDVIKYYSQIAGNTTKTKIEQDDYETNDASDFTGVSDVPQATFVIQNAGVKDLGATVSIDGVNTDVLDVVASTENYMFAPEKGNKLTGTAVADVVDLTYAPVDNKIKGYTINTGLGNDDITGSKGNDTITAGLGNNNINIDLSEGEFGNDIVKVTKGELTNINFTNDIAGQIELTHNGKDAILTAYDSVAIGDFTKTVTEVSKLDNLTGVKKTVYDGTNKTVYHWDVTLNENAGGWAQESQETDATAASATFSINGHDLSAEEINALFAADGDRNLTATDVYQTVKTVIEYTVNEGEYEEDDTPVTNFSYAKTGTETTEPQFSYTFDDTPVTSQDIIDVLNLIEDEDDQITIVDKSTVLGTVTVQGIAAKDNVNDRELGGSITVTTESGDIFGNLNNIGMADALYDIDLAAKNDKGKNIYLNAKGDKATFKGTYVDESITLAGEGVEKTTLSLGGGNDTVLYNLNKKYGEVTVNAVKGDNVTLRDDNSVVLLDTINSEYKIDGKDVVVSVTRDNQTPADTSDDVSIVDFRIKNYAAKDPGATILNGVADLRNQTYDAVADKKGNYTTGTWLDEKAEAKDGLTYKLGLGSNVLTYWSKADDGVGAHAISSFADKGATINLTKGEELFVLDNAETPAEKLNFAYFSDGKDATATAFIDENENALIDEGDTKIGNFVFKGAAAKNLGADVIVGGDDLFAQDFALKGKEIKNKGLAYTGTWLNDVAEGTAKDDTFKLGTGDNKINMSGASAFGKDVVTLTKDEDLAVTIGNLAKPKQLYYEKVGNDIVANVAATNTIEKYVKYTTAGEAATSVTELQANEVYDDGGTLKVRTNTYNYTTHKWVVGEGEAAEEGAEAGITYKAKVNDSALVELSTEVVNAYLGVPAEDVYTEDASRVFVRTTEKTVYTWNATDAEHTQYKHGEATTEATTYAIAAGEEVNKYSYIFTGSTEEHSIQELGIVDTDTTQVVEVDASKDALGTVTFKNYAKDMSIADVAVNGKSLRDNNQVQIGIRTTGGTAQGTLGNDIFLVEPKAKKGAEPAFTVKDGVVSGLKNTFVETYTAEYGHGADTIISVEGAKDTIQISAGKGAEKLSASDYEFVYNGANDTLTIRTEGESIRYLAQKVDASGNRATDEDNEPLYADNLANVQFKDATGTAYQFTDKATNQAGTELDLSKAKTNNIAVGLDSEIVTFKDSAKNDIIYSTATEASSWTYTAGADKYLSTGNATDDTYNVTFGKKANLEISDAGNVALDETHTGDTLVLTAEKNKTLVADDLMLFFDVEKSGNDYKLGSDLKIMQKDAFKTAAAITNAINNDKFAGGVVEIDKYFSAAAKVTGVTADNDLTAVTGFTDGAGAGRIENIKIGETAYGAADKISAVAQEVAGWLANHANYDSAMAVIEAGNKNDVQSLLNVYQGASYIPAP